VLRVLPFCGCGVRRAGRVFGTERGCRHRVQMSPAGRPLPERQRAAR